MKKMLKIMAMLLVIGAVVFAAGCSDKKADTTAGNGSQEEVTDQTPVADNGTPDENISAEAPADNITVGNDSANITVEDNMSDDNISDDNMSDDNMSGDNDSINATNSSLNLTE